MPRNHCAFKIFLALDDGKEIGYRMYFQITEDKALFKHRGKNRSKKLKNVEKKSSIMDRIGNYLGVT